MSVLIAPIVPALRVAASTPEPEPTLHALTTAQITRIEANGGTADTLAVSDLDALYKAFEAEQILTTINVAGVEAWYPKGAIDTGINFIGLDLFSNVTFTLNNVTTGNWLATQELEGDGNVYLQGPNTITADQDFTWVIVERTRTSNSFNGSCLGFGDRTFFRIGPAGLVRMNAGDASSGQAIFQYQLPAPEANEPVIAIAVYSVGDFHLYVNGANVGSSTVSQSYPRDFDPFEIFSKGNFPGTSNYTDSIIPFAGFFPFKFTPAQAAAMHQALQVIL